MLLEHTNVLRGTVHHAAVGKPGIVGSRSSNNNGDIVAAPSSLHQQGKRSSDGARSSNHGVLPTLCSSVKSPEMSDMRKENVRPMERWSSSEPATSDNED